MPSNRLEYIRNWQRANPERRRATELKHKFGITVEQYNKMLAAQGGTCAICASTPGLRRLAVDHDHETGIVRGLLCGPCNRALGMFRDDPALLAAAIRYLQGT